MNTAYHNNNVKAAFETMRISQELSKALRVPAIKKFPFIEEGWPEGITKISQKMDYTGSIFKWLRDSKNDLKLRKEVVKLLKSNGDCLKTSLNLIGLYRKYCKAEGIPSYV